MGVRSEVELAIPRLSPTEFGIHERSFAPYILQIVNTKDRTGGVEGDITSLEALSYHPAFLLDESLHVIDSSGSSREDFYFHEEGGNPHIYLQLPNGPKVEKMSSVTLHDTKVFYVLTRYGGGIFNAPEIIQLVLVPTGTNDWQELLSRVGISNLISGNEQSDNLVRNIVTSKYRHFMNKVK